eukprot:5536674-Prymnesium_polylepis.1
MMNPIGVSVRRWGQAFRVDPRPPFTPLQSLPKALPFRARMSCVYIHPRLHVRITSNPRHETAAAMRPVAASRGLDHPSVP